VKGRRGLNLMDYFIEFRKKYCTYCKLAMTRGCDIERQVDNYGDKDALCSCENSEEEVRPKM